MARYNKTLDRARYGPGVRLSRLDASINEETANDMGEAGDAVGDQGAAGGQEAGGGVGAQGGQHIQEQAGGAGNGHAAQEEELKDDQEVERIKWHILSVKGRYDILNECFSIPK